MKKYSIVLLLVSVSISFGQRKYSADKYFEEFAYVRSAELYNKLYEKGNTSQLVLSRLGDSYYFNSNFKASEVWYHKLFLKYEKGGISPIYYFRYAQSLKANGNYKESDKWLLKIRTMNPSDIRVASLSKQLDYVSEFSNIESQFEKIHNMSSNSKYSDYGAFSHGSKVIFSSTRPKYNTSEDQIYLWNEQPYYNLYEADNLVFRGEKSINFSDLHRVRKISEVNSPYHDASAILTKDGKTMYFTRDNFDGNKLHNDQKQVTHLKIYKAELQENGVWGEVQELSFNSESYSVGHPALSLDEKTLFFTSDMPGGFGATDIYKIAIKEDGSFGDPENLGEIINTEGDEMFPYIANNRVLYFSSNGHIGLGGLDVFKYNLQEINSKVSNVGSPINSQKDDFSFTVNFRTKIGYFSSNRSGGKGDDDMYSFVVRDVPIACKQVLEGVVFDKETQKRLPGTKVYLKDLNDEKIDSILVGDTATFRFEALCKKRYKVTGEKAFFIPAYRIFDTPGSSGITDVKLALEIKSDFVYADSGELMLKINPIYFDFDRSTIRTDASLALERVISMMKKYPLLILKATSHTDSRGNDSYNMLLSKRRANATVKYLVSKGIDASRIAVQSYGETRPVNECLSEEKCADEAHQLNRRTQFVIKTMGVSNNIKNDSKINKSKR